MTVTQLLFITRHIYYVNDASHIIHRIHDDDGGGGGDDNDDNDDIISTTVY
jgi:hypothetical protein